MNMCHVFRCRPPISSVRPACHTFWMPCCRTLPCQFNAILASSAPYVFQLNCECPGSASAQALTRGPAGVPDLIVSRHDSVQA